MTQVLHTPGEVAEKISAGKKLILAGDENLLKELPEGHWIGGTIPYFMSEEGGVFSQEKIYVTELPDYIHKIVIRTYNTESIKNIFNDIPENGFGVVIIPALSKLHLPYAVNAPTNPGFATSPVIGWISGVNLNAAEPETAKVFMGEHSTIISDNAVAMIITLPDDKYAEIDIVNIFKQGDGPEISFAEDGFSAKKVLINGVEKNFAEYIAENEIDIKLPLVADYCGAMINISFQSIDDATGMVNFYAPVFKGITYKHAAPVGD